MSNTRNLINNYISAKIKELRFGKNPYNEHFTQEEFAKFANVSAASVINLENHKQGPTLVFLYKIADAFDIPIEDLLPPVSSIFDPKALPGLSAEFMLALSTALKDNSED